MWGTRGCAEKWWGGGVSDPTTSGVKAETSEEAVAAEPERVQKLQIGLVAKGPVN